MKKIQIERSLTPEEEIRERAKEVFGDESVADAWLTSPSYGLGHKTPTFVLRTRGGKDKVLALLNRIEHGIYA